MPDQSSGPGFLERMLRKGKKQNALLNMPQSGGIGMPSPTGLGSGQAPPPRPTPAAAAQIAPAGGTPMAAPEAAAAPPPDPDMLPLPSLDEEFPLDTLAEPMAGQQVFSAGSLTDRFYRTYGRAPTETDMYVLNIRRQFETKRGRSPSKRDIMEAMKRVTETREVRPI